MFMFFLLYNFNQTSGEWEHGKRQGMGLLQHANGDVYNGEFHQDREQGLCTLRYSSGDNYFGEMHHGRRTGHGLMEYASGVRLLALLLFLVVTCIDKKGILNAFLTSI